MKFDQMSALMRDTNEVGQMNVLTFNYFGKLSFTNSQGWHWLKNCLVEKVFGTKYANQAHGYSYGIWNNQVEGNKIKKINRD